MKRLLAISMALLWSVAADAQTKPSPEYLKELHRHKEVTARLAKDQKRFNEKHQRDIIEIKGLEYWLSVNTKQDEFLNYDLEVFMPKPKPEPAKESSDGK